MTPTRLILALGLVSALLIGASVFFGSAALSITDVLRALGQGADKTDALIVWEIRLPRAAAAFGVGAALGASGAAMQGLLQNPLADPGVLGVSSAASLGAVLMLYFGLALPGSVTLMAAAIVFALIAMVLLFAIAGAKSGTLQLVLTGLGLSSLCGALVSLAFNLAPNPYSLADLINWTLGSVANRSWNDVLFVLPPWALGAVALWRAAPGLKALTLGEETALSLGADPKSTRAWAVGATALLTGASVAIAGAVGFVGLVAPHLVRRFVRHDPAALLLPSALAGGVLLLIADAIIRSGLIDPDLKLGVVAALAGAPMFILIAARTESVSR